MRVLALLSLVVSTVALPNSELSVDWIYRATRAGKAHSIETLLSRFSPKSLERRLLAYHSGSRQYASYLSPRVIVYSYDADFIMAFNGEPGSEGYHELEILEFDHERSAFRPRLFRFDPAGRRPP